MRLGKSSFWNMQGSLGLHCFFRSELWSLPWFNCQYEDHYVPLLWRIFRIKIQFISHFYVQPSFFKFSAPFIQPWHLFFKFNIRFFFNLGSPFLCSAFFLFKHNIRYLSSTFVLFKHDDFVICFSKRMMLCEKRMTTWKQMSCLSNNI